MPLVEIVKPQQSAQNTVKQTSTQQLANASTNSSKAFVSQDESLRAYSGRAELRHHNQILKLLCVFLIITISYTNYAWYTHSNYLAKQQYVVYEVNPDGKTNRKNSAFYQDGPTDQEIRYVSWQFVKWIVTAGSNDVDRCYIEARNLLHPSVYSKFDEFSSKVKPGIRELKIYRRVPNADSRFMDTSDLTPGSTGQISRYDVIVTGTIESYRVSNNELSDKRNFAFHIRLLPLEARTDANPYALVVADFEDVKLPDANTNK